MTPECPAQLTAWMAAFPWHWILWIPEVRWLIPLKTDINTSLTVFPLCPSDMNTAVSLDGSRFFSYQKIVIQFCSTNLKAGAAGSNR
jgi:hypothetical protein